MKISAFNTYATQYARAQKQSQTSSAHSSDFLSQLNTRKRQSETSSFRTTGQTYFSTHLDFLQSMASKDPEYATALAMWNKAWNYTNPISSPGVLDPITAWKNELARPVTDQFNAIILKNIPRENSDLGGLDNLSPVLQLDHYYKQWSAEHPKTLSDSKGLTEENIAYLREHYSGDLSAMELMDVVDTLKQMKIISHDENSAIYGTQSVIETAVCGLHASTRGAQSYPSDFDAPIVAFHTLDDIFNWLKKRREEVDPFEEERRLRDFCKENFLEPENDWYLRMEDEDLISRDLSLDAWFTSK